MKLSAKLKKVLRTSAIFLSLAVVLAAPGIVHCSGSVDPEGTTVIDII